MTRQDIFSKQELEHALAKGHDQITGFVRATHIERCFVTAPGGWSIAQHLEHLRISAEQFAPALHLPKIALRLRFGTPQRASGAFDTLHARYQALLAGGLAATGAFVPELIGAGRDASAAQGALIQIWQKSTANMLDGLQAWSDENLDQHQLPHPALGMLTMREMLMFFVFHDQHHLQDMQRLA